MLFSKTTFLGIDPTAGEKPFVYAALDNDLRLLALGGGNIDDMLAFAAGQAACVAAVCAPPRPNQGLMRREGVRAALSPAPHPGRWENCRVADYQLRLYQLSIPATPDQESACSGWMRMGFSLHRRLAELDYCAYPQAGERQALEVYPYACYAALLERLPFPKHTLEGRLQRQLALFERKLGVPDPMDFFEEVTRHRLLRGILPLEMLYSAGELDALAAAYTAWLAAVHPEQISLLGDPGEGQVVLPTAAPKLYA
ncbi:MAG: DUF429 domain-containing protein [Chloroflexota bacterium]